MKLLLSPNIIQILCESHRILDSLKIEAKIILRLIAVVDYLHQVLLSLVNFPLNKHILGLGEKTHLGGILNVSLSELLLYKHKLLKPKIVLKGCVLERINNGILRKGNKIGLGIPHLRIPMSKGTFLLVLALPLLPVFAHNSFVIVQTDCLLPLGRLILSRIDLWSSDNRRRHWKSVI